MVFIAICQYGMTVIVFLKGFNDHYNGQILIISRNNKANRNLD